MPKTVAKALFAEQALTRLQVQVCVFKDTIVHQTGPFLSRLLKEVSRPIKVPSLLLCVFQVLMLLSRHKSTASLAPRGTLANHMELLSRQFVLLEPSVPESIQLLADRAKLELFPLRSVVLI
jgi:hypothetical protein